MKMVVTKYKNFEEFFRKATGHDPYPYQTRLAVSDTPSVISVPTGAGKTEAAILGLYLWKNISQTELSTRLIYCLPMRVLVEQTVSRIKTWIKNLGLEGCIRVYTLMGGSMDVEFQKHPDDKCIVVGTQDMLISGALNRAYGNTPFSWPVVFGLFNNDCMWIMDEVQIMENALPTSIQLDAFRNQYKTFGACRTVWMSATITSQWFNTVDSLHINPNILGLKPDDENSGLNARNNAVKILHKTGIKIKNYNDLKIVKKLHSLHKNGTVTIIMVNTVKRAQELYDALSSIDIRCKLVHSRFRSIERNNLNNIINNISDKQDHIIISTQVLEAGVDISARTLITEIAPWYNLVQRFGRCNRSGSMHHADVYWLDVEDTSSGPYDTRDLEKSRDILALMDKKSVSPANLPSVNDNEKIFDSVLRRRDLHDLFDNSVDLSGGRTDASRFVRTSKQKLDVEVFWRDSVGKGPKPKSDETCSVSIGDIKQFLGKNKNGYIWNHTEGRWQRITDRDVMPGQTIMLDSRDGGYSVTRGWDKNTRDVVDTIADAYEEEDSVASDPQSKSNVPVTLEKHTRHVIAEIEHLLNNSVDMNDNIKTAIRYAVKYHDVGKLHAVFQDTMIRGMQDPDRTKIWAKTKKLTRHKRRGFRHEAASALLYLKQISGAHDYNLKNLIAYLIISHHGKIRMSMRNTLASSNDEYLLGIRVAGDTIRGFVSDLITTNEEVINMSMARIGTDSEENPSWTERVLSLLDAYGPFRLAYMEAIVRAADMLASQKENEGRYT